jgi:hypothetical protein
VYARKPTYAREERKLAAHANVLLNKPRTTTIMSSNSSSSAFGSWPMPNYVNPETRGPAGKIVGSTLISLVTVIVALRIYTRHFISKSLGLDDILILLSYVRHYVRSSCSIDTNVSGRCPLQPMLSLAYMARSIYNGTGISGMSSPDFLFPPFRQGIFHPSFRMSALRSPFLLSFLRCLTISLKPCRTYPV